MSNQNRANKNSFVKAQMKNIDRLQNQYNRVQKEINTINRLNTPPNKNKRNKLEKMKMNLQKQMIKANNSIQRVNEQLKKRNEDKRRKEKELKNYEASIFRGLSKNLMHSNKELAALNAQISNMERSLKMNNASKKELERMKKRRNTLKQSMTNTTKILKQNNLNTTNIKTIYRDIRNNLTGYLNALIKALNEKHEAAVINFKYGGFENEAKKLKKELSKGAHNVKDEYTFIGNIRKLFNKIIKFLHKIKPHIEKSLRKDRKGKTASNQVLASRQIGHAYLNIVAYLKSIDIHNKNRKLIEIKNLNKNVQNKLKSLANANAKVNHKSKMNNVMKNMLKKKVNKKKVNKKPRVSGTNYSIGLAASMFANANARVNHQSKMKNVMRNIKEKSVKKPVFNNENIPPSLINTEAGKEYYRGLRQHIPKPLQNKSSAPKHLQLIPTSTNLVPKSKNVNSSIKNVNSSIKNLKLQLNLPNGVTLPDIRKLMRTTNRTNTNKNTARAQLLISLYKLLQKQKKGIKTTNMGPQELLLLENGPTANNTLRRTLKKTKKRQDPFNRSQYNSNNSFFNNSEITENWGHNLKEEQLKKELNQTRNNRAATISTNPFNNEFFKERNASKKELNAILNKIKNLIGYKYNTDSNKNKIRLIESAKRNIGINISNLKHLNNKNRNLKKEEIRKISNLVAKAEKKIKNIEYDNKFEANPFRRHQNKRGVIQPRKINGQPPSKGQPSIGGSRTVHIKGVGKRVVRQTKTGRKYVLVNKKKRYLN